MQPRIKQPVLWLVLLFVSSALLMLNEVGPALILIGVCLFGAFLSMSLYVVKEYNRLVILRMGRCIGSRGPGLVFVLPFVDNPIEMDMRERYKEVAHESCITQDNATIDVDFLFYWKVINPVLAVTKVQNLDDALRQLATGLLRAVIGDISLDAAFSERDHINRVLQDKIDEVTVRWGVDVTTVEIREILMPMETREIMTRQMAAERSKRAAVLEAQGNAEALTLLNEAAKYVDVKTMNLKYLETLRQLGQGESTKYIFPLEFTSLVRSIASGLSIDAGNGDGQPPAPEAAPPAEGEPAAQAEGNGHAVAPSQHEQPDAVPAGNGHAPSGLEAPAPRGEGPDVLPAGNGHTPPA